MIETNLLNHNWSLFVILSGLTLHQFKKKLLLRGYFRGAINTDPRCRYDKWAPYRQHNSTTTETTKLHMPSPTHPAWIFHAYLQQIDAENWGGWRKHENTNSGLSKITPLHSDMINQMSNMEESWKDIIALWVEGGSKQNGVRVHATDYEIYV